MIEARLEDFVERHVIADCGHWTQHEAPEEVDRVTLEWIQWKFRDARRRPDAPDDRGRHDRRQICARRSLLGTL